jgi:hypothetical protein
MKDDEKPAALEEVLKSVWQQALVERAKRVKVGGTSFSVRRTAKLGIRLRLLFAIGSGLQCRGEKRDPVPDLVTSSAFIIQVTDSSESA